MKSFKKKLVILAIFTVTAGFLGAEDDPLDVSINEIGGKVNALLSQGSTISIAIVSSPEAVTPDVKDKVAWYVFDRLIPLLQKPNGEGLHSVIADRFAESIRNRHGLMRYSELSALEEKKKNDENLVSFVRETESDQALIITVEKGRIRVRIIPNPDPSREPSDPRRRPYPEEIESEFDHKNSNAYYQLLTGFVRADPPAEIRSVTTEAIVVSCDFFPGDSNTSAVALADGQVLIQAGGITKRVLRESGAIPAKRVRFTPDASSLVVAAGNAIEIFDAQTYESRGVIPVAGEVNALCCGDGMIVVGTSAGGLAFDFFGKQLFPFGSGGPVSDIVLDIERIFSAEKNTVHIYANTGKPLESLEEKTEILSLALSPNRKNIAIGLEDSVSIRDLASKTVVTSIKEQATNLKYSRNGMYIYSASQNGGAYVWNSGGVFTYILEQPETLVNDLVINETGTHVGMAASASHRVVSTVQEPQGSLSIYNQTDRDITVSLAGEILVEKFLAKTGTTIMLPIVGVYRLKLDDQDALIGGRSEADVTISQNKDKPLTIEAKAVLKAETEGSAHALYTPLVSAFNRRNGLLATGYGAAGGAGRKPEAFIKVINTKTGEIKTLKSAQSVTALAWRGENELAAAAAGLVTMYDLSSGSSVEFPHKSAVKHIDSDGNRLAVLLNTSVIVYNTQEAVFSGPVTQGKSVFLFGRYLVVVGSKKLSVFDTESPDGAPTEIEVPGGVQSAARHANTLALAGGDETLKIFSIPELVSGNGKPLASFPIDIPVTSLAFDTAAGALFAADAAGNITTVNISTGAGKVIHRGVAGKMSAGGGLLAFTGREDVSIARTDQPKSQVKFLFYKDNSEVLINPEGYFDATDFGTRHIFQVRGKTKNPYTSSSGSFYRQSRQALFQALK